MPFSYWFYSVFIRFWWFLNNKLILTNDFCFSFQVSSISLWFLDIRISNRKPYKSISIRMNHSGDFWIVSENNQTLWFNRQNNSVAWRCSVRSNSHSIRIEWAKVFEMCSIKLLFICLYHSCIKFTNYQFPNSHTHTCLCLSFAPVQKQQQPYTM